MGRGAALAGPRLLVRSGAVVVVTPERERERKRVTWVCEREAERDGGMQPGREGRASWCSLALLLIVAETGLMSGTRWQHAMNQEIKVPFCLVFFFLLHSLSLTLRP